MSVDTEQAAPSRVANSKMQSYHKSCLRQRQRRLSDTTLGGGGGGLPKNDSMDDCSSYSYSSSMSDDGGAESGSSSSRFSSCDGLLSRKSVSFADSVGEDLCHVKVFSKELCEYDDEQVRDNKQ